MILTEGEFPASSFLLHPSSPPPLNNSLLEIKDLKHGGKVRPLQWEGEFTKLSPPSSQKQYSTGKGAVTLAEEHPWVQSFGSPCSRIIFNPLTAGLLSITPSLQAFSAKDSFEFQNVFLEASSCPGF